MASLQRGRSLNPILTEDIAFLCYDHTADAVVDYRMMKKTPLKQCHLDKLEDHEDAPGTLCDACPFCGDVCGCLDCPACQSSTPPSPRSSSSGRTFTTCQVARHNMASSAWVVLEKGDGAKVLDVSSYILDHPGGIRSILRRAGTGADCSVDLSFHSPAARKKWHAFTIGTLTTCPGKAKQGKKEEKQDCVIS
eukprot:CAMPEP_0171667046 /NCGR_PEP_ID=MMETSP0990-20121206/48475_1 /TAXON_ID=483369 /ORGANISM="non described non described, Strain CCMP2098" /LENGTH=192 /DNA_ID=CAMNT_0012250699 /DNA_START=796 /DNA_END=1374 /DNA_ORIENTATION=+